MKGIFKAKIAGRLSNLAARRLTVVAFLASGLNQVFGSLTNLILNIYFVRQLSQSEFGLYNIAFAITVSIGALANSVFLLPMTVDLPQNQPEKRDCMMLDVTVTIAMVLLVTSTLVSLGMVVAERLSLITAATMSVAVVTMIACAAYLLKECMVQASFNQRREYAAVWINVSSALGVLGVTAAAFFSKAILSASGAILIYASSQAIGAMVGYRLVFLNVKPSSFAGVARRLILQLRRGAWSTAAGVLTMVRTQAHTISVTALLGPVGVAQINAARLMFAPVQMAQPAIVRAAMPRLLRQRDRNLHAFRTSAMLLSIGLASMSGLYGAVMLITGPYFYAHIVSKAYSYSAALFGTWALVFTLVALRGGLELKLQALGRFVDLTRIAAFTMVATLAAVFFLTHVLGAPGALVGLAFGEGVSCILLHVTSRKNGEGA